MDYIARSPEQGPRENPFPGLWEGPDEQGLVLLRQSATFLVLNRYPYNPGHLMALPRREVSSPSDLTVEERHELWELVIRGQECLTRVMRPDGFNIGFNVGRAAGAGIPKHLHIHIVPRWEGDNNFLPVIGQTRTLPEALSATWHKLREALHA